MNANTNDPSDWATVSGHCPRAVRTQCADETDSGQPRRRNSITYTWEAPEIRRWRDHRYKYEYRHFLTSDGQPTD